MLKAACPPSAVEEDGLRYVCHPARHRIAAIKDVDHGVQLQAVSGGQGQVLVKLRPVEDALLWLELIPVDDMEPAAQPRRRRRVQHLVEALVDAEAGRVRPLVRGVAAGPAPDAGARYAVVVHCCRECRQYHRDLEE